MKVQKLGVISNSCVIWISTTMLCALSFHSNSSTCAVSFYDHSQKEKRHGVRSTKTFTNLQLTYRLFSKHVFFEEFLGVKTKWEKEQEKERKNYRLKPR